MEEHKLLQDHHMARGWIMSLYSQMPPDSMYVSYMQYLPYASLHILNGLGHVGRDLKTVLSRPDTSWHGTVLLRYDTARVLVTCHDSRVPYCDHPRNVIIFQKFDTTWHVTRNIRSRHCTARGHASHV